MQTSFVGRKDELEAMDRAWTSDRAELIILYGRRRVGKTRLLTHWIKKHEPDGLYWMAEATSAFDQLRSFSQAVADFEDPEVAAPLDLSYPNWDYALRRVAKLAQERRVALFIDEVTYLLDVTPAIVGTFQKAWDQWLSNSNIFLALCGSQMGLMQKELLSHEAPLYGRSTIQMKLEPLRFGATSRFFPNYDARERVTLYAIWGGIPAYWERLDQSIPVLDNLRLLLSPANSWMMDEPRLLLNDFVNDPHNYVGVMRTIAKGTHTFSAIGRQTGLSMGHTSQYLSLLRDTSFVVRQTPVSDNSPNSRRGRYYVTDPYLRFYYRFLAAYHSKLALGQHDQTLDLIGAGMPEYIRQYTWPELCREWLLRASDRGELPVTVDDAGAEWRRNFTLDVAGINQSERQLVLGACHWDEGPAGLELIEELAERSRSVVPKDEDGWTIYYLGFARDGWTEDAQERAADMLNAARPGSRASNRWRVAGVRLLSLEDVDEDLAQWTR
ncbi:MAG: ATP-binding protein [Chloroflexota bacterium]